MEITLDYRTKKGAVQHENTEIEFEIIWLYNPKNDTNNIERNNLSFIYSMLINVVFWNSQLIAGDLLNGTARIR